MNLKERAKDVARSYVGEVSAESGICDYLAEYKYKSFLAGVEWAEKEILSEGIVVYGANVDQFGKLWREEYIAKASGDARNKALLINIQPIVRESAEDVLRDIIAVYEADVDSLSANDTTDSGIYKRAKAVLNKGSECE